MARPLDPDEIAPAGLPDTALGRAASQGSGMEAACRDVVPAAIAGAPVSALGKPDAEREKLDLEKRKLCLERRKFALERRKFRLEEEKNARSRWWHEDQLVNHRLTWLLTSQGLLFAGLFVLVQPRVMPAGETPYQSQDGDLLKSLLPVAGFVGASLVLVATVAARWAQAKLARHYGRNRARWTLGVSGITTFLSMSPSIVLPGLFMLLWASLGRRYDTLAVLCSLWPLVEYLAATGRRRGRSVTRRPVPRRRTTCQAGPGGHPQARFPPAARRPPTTRDDERAAAAQRDPSASQRSSASSSSSSMRSSRACAAASTAGSPV